MDLFRAWLGDVHVDTNMGPYTQVVRQVVRGHLAVVVRERTCQREKSLISVGLVENMAGDLLEDSVVQ